MTWWLSTIQPLTHLKRTMKPIFYNITASLSWRTQSIQHPYYQFSSALSNLNCLWFLWKLPLTSENPRQFLTWAKKSGFFHINTEFDPCSKCSNLPDYRRRRLFRGPSNCEGYEHCRIPERCDTERLPPIRPQRKQMPEGEGGSEPSWF